MSLTSHKNYMPREDLPAFSVPRHNLLRLEIKFKGASLFQWVGGFLCVVLALLIMFILPLNFIDFTARAVIAVFTAFLFGVGLLYPFNELTALQWFFQIRKFRKSRIGRRTRSRLEVTEEELGDTD